MKKLILAAAAAAFLIPATAAVPTTANAQDYSVRISSDGYRHDYGHHYGWRHRHHGYRSFAYSPGCRTIVTRTHHHGRLIIKKVRRCY